MKLVCYQPELKKEWDQFLKTAKNGHFFFHRDYMEYHSDRFEDASLLVLDEKSNVLALFPASRSGESVYSHQGLTFGGLLTNEKLRAAQVIEALELLTAHFRELGAKELIYKAIPSIYHTTPAQEDLYSLFRLDAQLFRRDLSSSIDLSQPVRYSKGRKWGVNKAKKEGVEITESPEELAAYWVLLEEVLKARHESMPVHSLSEIQLLMQRFPKNIRLYVAKYQGELVSGALLFVTNGVVHTQYLANSLQGRDVGALDLLIHQLITEVFSQERFFDFGISNEDGGRVLNEGLIAQKEGFGARGVAHDFYRINLV